MKNLIETSFNRFKKHFDTNDVAIISACRKYAEDDKTRLSKKENLARTKSLAHDLWLLGYGYSSVTGSYVEPYIDKKTGKEIKERVIEYSFLVFNNNDPKEYHTEFLEDMKHLANKYNQDSVLVKLKGQPGHYYYQDGHIDGNFTTINDDVVTEYFTRLRGKIFTLEAVTESRYENRSRRNANYGTLVGRSELYKEFLKLMHKTKD